MKVVLAPDVYVNASVALGSPPERVVTRVLGNGKHHCVASEWVMDRIVAMLHAIPDFKKAAVGDHVKRIRDLVEVQSVKGKFGAEAWVEALSALAVAAGADRIVTDHPDLLASEQQGSAEFMSSEAWLLEQGMPPPVPHA